MFTRYGLFIKLYYDNQMEEGDVGGARSTLEEDEKYLQNFGWKTWAEETTRKT